MTEPKLNVTMEVPLDNLPVQEKLLTRACFSELTDFDQVDIIYAVNLPLRSATTHDINLILR